MNNGFLNNQEAQRIQDQFILNSTIIKFQYEDGQIQQLRRQYNTIEKVKETNEDSCEIIQAIDQIKKELIKNYNYEIVKYQGRNSISLNFIGKVKELRVLHSISCLILKNQLPDTIKGLDSTLDKIIKLEHPYVQKMIKYEKAQKFYFIIMEECLGSFEELAMQERNKINQNSFLKYSCEYIQGLDYLVGKMQISSSVCELRNIRISFNHIGIVPVFIAAMAEIKKQGILPIQEYINSITNSVYSNTNNSSSTQNKKQNIIVENYATNGQLTYLLVSMLLPQKQHPIQKNYIANNKKMLLESMGNFESREQLLNLIIDIESFYDSTLTQQVLNNFITSINHLKKGQKWFLKPLDISISQMDQNILAFNFYSYDFAQVSNGKFVPMIEQDLMNTYYHIYKQQLHQLKRNQNQQIHSEYYNSLKSIPMLKENTSISRVNDQSTIMQYSNIKIQGDYGQNQDQNIQILEEFVSERVEDIDLDDVLDEEELKNIIDSLCNNNENADNNSSNKFDSQLFSEIIDRIKRKGEKIKLQSFLEVYIEYEKDLVYQYQMGQNDYVEGSLFGRQQITLTNEHKNSIIRDLESPFKEKEGERKDTVFTNEHELHTQGNAKDLKEKIQLLHKPFYLLLNPPSKLDDIKVNKLMQEIMSVKKDIDFKVAVREEDIFKLLDSLNVKHSKIPYDKKPFLRIFESIQKKNQILNTYNFLTVYLETCNELQQKLTNLVVQNCDIKSLDQSQLKNIVTFHNVKQHMDSIHELNYLEYTSDFKQLKAPFKRLYQKTYKPISKTNITKKIQENDNQKKIPRFDAYTSKLDEINQPYQSSTISIILYIGIICFFLAFVALILYCVW